MLANLMRVRVSLLWIGWPAIAPAFAALAILILAISSMNATVAAHQAKVAVTTLSINPRSGKLEIMHRFILHDAEHAVKQIYGEKVDIIHNADTRKAFEQYVRERFAIMAGGQLLELEFIGSEVDGASLWIYQQSDIPMERPVQLAIENSLMMDLWPSQENRLNLGNFPGVETLIFKKDAPVQRGTLPEKRPQ